MNNNEENPNLRSNFGPILGKIFQKLISGNRLFPTGGYVEDDFFRDKMLFNQKIPIDCQRKKDSMLIFHPMKLRQETVSLNKIYLTID